MNKEKYIQQEVLRLVQTFSAGLFLAGALVILSLSILDYFVVREHFWLFLFYRFIAASLYIPLYFIIKNSKKAHIYQILIILSALIVSTMVELMILDFGGHQSPYYTGMIIVFIFLFGFLPIPVNLTLFLALMIYLVYILPILIFDHISNIPIFINNNIFLIATMAGGITWRYFNYKLLMSNLSLQYDLEQQKKQLESYSLQLKAMVEERTKELHKSEQWHKSLFENATDGIVVLDKNGIIVNVNDKACEMHGFTRDALIGTHIKLLEDDTNKEKTAARMRRIMDGESLVFETKHNKKDGAPLHLEISSKAITIGEELFVQSFYRDITEKKKLQENMFQSQKMESIGVLAGGIAHDFNNVLTAILGHTELIRRTSSLGERAVRSLEVIEDASRRAGRMISKLMGFARKTKFELAPINLNDVVYDTVKLLEQVINKSISLSVELDNGLPLVQGDINQMEQIIMNFIVNARDAMPNGGRIAIKTAAITVIKGMPDVPPYVPPGEYVQLSVSDTGTGIPEELVDKIFEPFFTTKERGKGTGLGLSMVYGAVKEHQGFLSVQSSLGVGSVFIVYLPVSCAAPAGEKEPEASLNGTETLLIVDDEEEILNVMQDTLESHGYKVLATTDSSVALDIYRNILHEAALIITDIVMPSVDGRELIRQIKLINPAIKVLAVSGYTKYVAEKEDIKDIDGFLKKPFESYNLLSVVRRILDAKGDKAIRV